MKWTQAQKSVSWEFLKMMKTYNLHFEILDEKLRKYEEEKRSIDGASEITKRDLARYSKEKIDRDILIRNVEEFLESYKSREYYEKRKTIQDFIDQVFIDVLHIRLGVKVEPRACGGGSKLNANHTEGDSLNSTPLLIDRKYTWKKNPLGKKEITIE